MKWAVAVIVVLLTALTAVGTSGALTVPVLSPIDPQSCKVGGLVPSLVDNPLQPGEFSWHGVPLPPSRRGAASIESVHVEGSVTSGDLSLLVLEAPAFGAYRGTLEQRWASRAVPVDVARLNSGGKYQLLVGFSAESPGRYDLAAFRMVFRQGLWRSRCTKAWGAEFVVATR
jgi:hypothetical protein